jgi:2-oxoglutarate dehydrogenase complex dihydrolipoamide succinyltransferase (E2) component
MVLELEFRLPDLGEGVAEGEIVKWLVEEGQQIKEDEPMVEVMTDKATVQIPSPTTGVVKQILAKEGQTVKVGTNLVILDKDGSSPSPQVQSQKGQEVSSPKSAPQQQQEHSGNELGQATSKMAQQQDLSQRPRQVIATPATRKLARDLGIDIELVTGSGPAGRITEQDVRSAAGSKKATPQTIPLQRPIQQELQQALESPNRPQAAETVAEGRREERLAIHGIRKRIADKMLKSALGTASVTHVDEIDLTELVALREAIRATAEEKKVRLTYLPFIIKALIATLRHFPYFNASIDEEKKEIVLKHFFNIGVAADTPNGLIVPVVKDADKKDIFEIAREIERLSESARNGNIELNDIQGGTFTVTNIGTLGGVISTPIINIPEVAILGVHKIEKRPVVRNNEIVIRDMVYVALTFDHRIVDGADAARFTTKLKQFLENPALIFIDEYKPS